MFDIGGWEFLVIVVVALVVIGPKDLPAAVKAISAWIGKARELAREFRGGLDELQREVELDRIEKEVKDSLGADEMSRTANSIRGEIEDAGRDLGKAAEPARQIRDEWEEAYTYFQDKPAAPGAVEEEALRRLKDAEADEREAAAALPPAPGQGPVQPAVPQPPAPAPDRAAAGEESSEPPAQSTAGGRAGA